MGTLGLAHLGLGTHDMNATIAFYESRLAFPRVADISNRTPDGGVVRMVYFDLGDEQFLVFMEPKGVSGIPEDFDTGINAGLGVPSGMYHLALKVDSVAALLDKGRELRAYGIEVSGPVDHGYAQSIYIRDPNHIQIEFCCMTRKFNSSDLQRVVEVQVATPASDGGRT